MTLTAHAKAGLAWRFALAQAIEGRMSLKAARGRLQRLAGDRTPLVAPLVEGGWAAARIDSVHISSS
jgi:hypothetical protein